MSAAYRDKVAIVTGAASGIGRALAAALGREGARVILSDRDVEALEATARQLSGNFETAPCDVTDGAALRQLIEGAAARHGRLDYLFNNAGVGLAGELRDTRLEDWKRVLEVNLWGVIYGISAAYPIMIEQGFGHIVNTASGAGLGPRPGMAAYAAAKHAVVGLSNSLRAEARDLGVKVSVVCPGYIATNIMNSTEYRKLDDQGLRARIPIKPMSAEDCARVILRGVRRNRAIIPVTRIAWLDWLLYRFAPALSIYLSAIRIRQFRKHRVE